MPRPSRTGRSSVERDVAAAGPACSRRSMWRMTRSPSGPYFRYTRRMSFGIESMSAIGWNVVCPCSSVDSCADLEVEDEALVLEHLGDVRLQLGGRHVDGGPLDPVGVADAGQHVGDRVGHHGTCIPHQLAFVHARDQAVAGHVCGSRSGRCRTCGTRPAAGRRAAAQPNADHARAAASSWPCRASSGSFFISCRCASNAFICIAELRRSSPSVAIARRSGLLAR